jgi:uncharacterized protein YndB with AHSA1/START domain
MPTGKDLKRLVRARMEKTGESYTAARAQLLNKHVTVRLKADTTAAKVRDYATIAGMSDASVKKATGCTWQSWVKALDKMGAAEKPHRDIAKIVASFDTPSWWTQMVTVGYERIRGLRDRGQQRGGGYQATKSRTVNVPLPQLYAAFSNARTRRRWLDDTATVKSVSPNKRARLAWADGTSAIMGFYARGASKSIVAVEHLKLSSKADADARKKAWGEAFDKLAAITATSSTRRASPTHPRRRP